MLLRPVVGRPSDVTSVGPFSMDVLVSAACALLAWLVARSWRRGRTAIEARQAASIVFDAVLVGVLGARLAFLAMHWQDYVSQPWSMLALGDGGYAWPAGLACALGLSLWMTRQRPLCRGPVLAGLMVGLALWLGAGAMQQRMTRSGPGLADVTAFDSGGQRIGLESLRGQPVVVNLWASWCPPCIRELPAFAQAQRELPGTAFVMLNQGESAQEVNEFLQARGITLQRVHLDPDSATLGRFEAQVMPTTLFFDAQGQLLDLHVGELTLGSLKSRLAAQDQ